MTFALRVGQSSRRSSARRTLHVAAGAAAVALLAPIAPAADFVFNPGIGGGTPGLVGDYNDPRNWAAEDGVTPRNAVPGETTIDPQLDRADIAFGRTATLSATPPTIDTLYLGGDDDGPGPNDAATGNTTGDGTLNQSGGALTVNSWAVLGDRNDGSTGTYNLSGGSFTMAGNDTLSVGQGSNGIMRISEASAVNVGAGGNNNADFIIGRWGAGDTRAQPTGGNGTVEQSGTSVVSVRRDLIVGLNGTARYALSGGSINMRDLKVAIGDGAAGNSTGTMAQSGGDVLVRGWTFIGTGGGTGTYNLSGGTYATDVGENRHLIGEGAGSTGTLAVSNGATFNASAGDSRMEVGLAGGTGTVNLSGATSTITFSNFINFGVSGGTGTGTQTGGTISTGSYFSIGTSGAGVGTYTISGGTMNVATDLNVSDVGTSRGTFDISGTALVNARDFFVSKVGGTQGVVNQTGGTVRVGSGTNAETGALIGQLAIATVDGTAGTYNLGGGVLDLQGRNINVGTGAPATGATTSFNFTGGRLQNAGQINLQPTQNFTQSGGTFAPGATSTAAARAAGITTINANSYTQAPGGTLEIDLNGTGTPGTNYDQLLVGGSLNVSGNLDLVLGYTPAVNDTYTIINYIGAQAGNFIGKVDDALFVEDGYTWRIDYQGGDGTDVVLTNLGVVPEPGTAMLLGGAAGFYCLLRRRRATDRRSSGGDATR